MMYRSILYLLIILWPCFILGQTKPGRYEKVFKEESAISSNIQSLLNQLEMDPKIRIGEEKIHNVEYIGNLYRMAGFTPFWTSSVYADDAIRGILNSYNDGLLPEDYHMAAISELLFQLTAPGDITEEDIARAAALELLLTDGILFYADHLLYGKVDPVTLSSTWNFGFAPIPDLNHETFRRNIENREIAARLESLRPSLFLYDTLRATLARYRDYEQQGGWLPIQAGGKIEPGDSDDRIPQVRHRLGLTGDLTIPDSTLSITYDASLEADIRRFQSLHGLDADGIIGAGTFRELNVPVEKRIETIRINLERVRWVAQNLPQSYLVVNIASFSLMLVKDSAIIHRANVVVGKTLNKTPVFRDKMRYIEFNPTWTVPTSIKKNEIIPHLKKDSAYLEKNHMVLLDSKGNTIPVSDLDLKNLSASNFPYIVRQLPGPWNALGVVKFMFPNEYDIYLHDTPSKSLFANAKRAYSHGCIRVEKPLDLAEILLQGTDWTRNKIADVIKTRETTRVTLSQPMDVLIMYWTCGLDLNREIFFTPDIYERDQDLLRELDRLLN